MPSSRPVLPALTSARFFAALLVLIFHYPAKQALFPAALCNFGYEPVTFFFVLSGFILTYTHAAGDGLNISGPDFARARFKRIFPTYAIALLISAPFFLWALIKHHQMNSGALLVPLMLQSWWPPASLAWNPPAWSLSNEVFFYALFPLAWSIMRKASPSQAVLCCLGMIAAADLARRAFTPSHDFSAYFPLLNLPQFLLGMALGSAFIAGHRCPRALLWGGVGMIAVSIVVKSEASWLISGLWLSGVFAATIAGLASFAPEWVAWRPLVMLGDASYAIYILHVPLLLWWDDAMHVRLRLEMPVMVDFALYLTIVVVASIAVTAALKRSQLMRRKRLHARQVAISR